MKINCCSQTSGSRRTALFMLTENRATPWSTLPSRFHLRSQHSTFKRLRVHLLALASDSTACQHCRTDMEPFSFCPVVQLCRCLILFSVWLWLITLPVIGVPSFRAVPALFHHGIQMTVWCWGMRQWDPDVWSMAYGRCSWASRHCGFKLQP